MEPSPPQIKSEDISSSSWTHNQSCTAADMILVAFLLLILLAADQASLEKVCSYQDVLDHLNLTADNDVFKMTRPVLDHTHPTTVKLEVILYAILGVIEKTQIFIPFVWATMAWDNEYIRWDPAQFCGITRVSVPHDVLWKPDLFIYEMVEEYTSPTTHKLLVHHDGTVFYELVMKVVSTCKMDVHKFPFDTQSCTISFSSGVYCVEELRLIPFSNSSRATQFSLDLMKSQGEWEFLELSVTSKNFTMTRTWDQLVYTVTVKRRPLLHVTNFLLPILFFLCLDLASYFIADHRGEKLGFKVTVLLAISVLLLILNDILPSMSNETPLIATYCIVIFALMLLSLLETILVTYLMEKDSENMVKEGITPADPQERVKHRSDDDLKGEDKRNCFYSCVCKVSDDRKPHDLLSVSEEVNDGVQTGESPVLLLILEELKKVQKTLNVHLSCRVEGGKCAWWATRINVAFFYFYICTVSLFLLFIFTEWTS